MLSVSRPTRGHARVELDHEVALRTGVGDHDPGGKCFGPALATASGLVFHGGTERPVLRVHDAETGRRITTFELPAGLHAGPISYKLRPDGKQFLVIAPGGHIGIGSPLGDYVIAYTLPD
jgi:glucose dehydrogenase